MFHKSELKLSPHSHISPSVPRVVFFFFYFWPQHVPHLGVMCDPNELIFLLVADMYFSVISCSI